MLDRKKDLRFILEKELEDLHKGMSKVDLLDDKDLDDIFITDRRDGIKSRFKDKLRLF